VSSQQKWQGPAPGNVINFFEANPSHVDKHLTQLWAVMDDIKQLSKVDIKELSTSNNAGFL